MSFGKVSVVIPTYNAKNHIEATLRSVLDQSYTDLEVWLVDDCSKDNTVQLIKEIQQKDARINLVQMEQNFGGPARGRNIGVSNSQGQYVAFLDSDDLWHRDKLSIQLNLMYQHGLKLTGTQRESFMDGDDDQLDLSTDFESESSRFKKVTLSELLRKNRFNNSSVVLERSLLSEVKISENKAHIAVEDYGLWLELHKRGVESAIIELPLLKYRIVGASLSRNKFGMLKKVNQLLSSYKDLKGNSLGLKKYPYLMSYMFLSVFKAKG